MLNVSAPFIAQFFKAQLDKVLEHTDILIGNESEAEAYATAAGFPNTTDLADIARRIVQLPKANTSKPRVVVFTHGAESTVLVSGDKLDAPKEYSVQKISDDKIVDTNGAGDAFAGGFLGALVAGKSLDDAVLAGHKLGGACVQQASYSVFSAYPQC